MTHRISFLRYALILTTALTLGGCDDQSSSQKNKEASAAVGSARPVVKTVAGNYLSAHYAQNTFDWPRAQDFLTEILALTPQNQDLQRRLMALALGSGKFDQALQLAREAAKQNSPGSLPKLVLALDAFKAGQFNDVLTLSATTPKDGLSNFVVPLMKSWAAAGLGKTDIQGLNGNAAHIYQAILIADFRKDDAALKALSATNLAALPLPVTSLERMSDIFQRHNLTQPARSIYETLRAGLPARADEFSAKISALKSSAADAGSVPSSATASPQDGLAGALRDMGGVLSDQFEDSARLFVQMSLYLAPDNPHSLELLASMAANHDQSEEAIGYLQRIDSSKDKDLRIKTQREVAEILENAKRYDQATKVLSDLVAQDKDVDSQIQIGDLYRHKEDFSRALTEYNKAYDLLDGKLSRPYWHLAYARGMTNERLHNWSDAEADLKTALSFEPNQPYVLNYLGYSWADQGINLDKATSMIAEAARLKPNDGAIVDSLGWVYYRKGDFGKSVRILEQAIELLPYDPTVNDHLGDAYWRVGRHAEAQFQWKRALSFAKDDALRLSLEHKIKNGLDVFAEGVLPQDGALSSATSRKD